MLKVRVYRYNGECVISRLTLREYLYGKIMLLISPEFRDGARIYNIKIVFPWQEKFLEKS